MCLPDQCDMPSMNHHVCSVVADNVHRHVPLDLELAIFNSRLCTTFQQSICSRALHLSLQAVLLLQIPKPVQELYERRALPWIAAQRKDNICQNKVILSNKRLPSSSIQQHPNHMHTYPNNSGSLMPTEDLYHSECPTSDP